MKAIRLGDSNILNADMIINCYLEGKCIKVWYTGNVRSDITYGAEEEAEIMFGKLYEALKEQEK